jgi:hypothetical protein
MRLSLDNTQRRFEMQYVIKGNKTAKDVVNENEQVIGYADNIEEARRLAIAAQSLGGFIAAWVERVLTPPARPARPVITRTIERDVVSRQRMTVVRCDGWVV